MNDEDYNRENGSELHPKFDSNGLISSVVTDDSTGELLMVAFMNEEALRLTIETGDVHFYSRSRKKLWKKGETSGHFLRMSELRIDCDQDAVWIIAKPEGPTCHTGRRSCFYRKMEDGKLVKVE